MKDDSPARSSQAFGKACKLTLTILGKSGSGKTVFLSSLYHQLAEGVLGFSAAASQETTQRRLRQPNREYVERPERWGQNDRATEGRGTRGRWHDFSERETRGPGQLATKRIISAFSCGPINSVASARRLHLATARPARAPVWGLEAFATSPPRAI